MKRTLIVLLVALLLVGCKSHQYVLQSVAPHRMEVTKALDAQPVPDALSFLAPYRQGVDSLRQPYVGRSELYMTADRPESLLGNWVSDVFVEAGKRYGYQPDLGLCNVGGLRAALPRDTVRKGDIISISPFENVLSILKMKGTDVLQLMRDIAAVHGEGVSSGARLVITRDGQLQSATLGGKDIMPDSLYTIATLDYLADGNDKMYALKRSVERVDMQEPIREVLATYLRELDRQGLQATAKIEGRIVETNEGKAPMAVRQKEIGNRSEAPIEITAAHQGTTKQLLIVHTNDTHSCVEPLSPHLLDTAHADKGGYLRRAALLRDLRSRDPELLLLDCGDFSQGSAYYNLYHGEVEVGLMNKMGYEAATIGNHEFDFGVENMARLFRQAEFPIVCCNYDFTGTACEGLVKPYLIIKRAGVKIGILGVAPQLEGLVAANMCQGVRYTDPIVAAQPIADYLKHTAKCDLVICLSHLGWMTSGVSDEEFIPATSNIDIVLGGHSHTYFASPQVLQNKDGVPVPDN
nr:5'-nucleotidase C-terminal domain-containing protein [Bacteroidaceae bacterium]